MPPRPAVPKGGLLPGSPRPGYTARPLLERPRHPVGPGKGDRTAATGRLRITGG